MGLLVSCLMLLALAAVVLLAAGRWSGLMIAQPYARRGSLLSGAERSFLTALEQAVGANFRIQVKVRAADVFAVSPSLGATQSVAAANRLAARHFDFVLVDSKNYAVAAAIVLDETLPRRGLRSSRDEFLGAVCASAQLPLIRIAASQDYPVTDLRRHILHTLFPPVIASDPIADHAVGTLLAAK